MRDDAVYTYSPRWLEESGLPEALNRDLAPGAWSLFKKLTEAEVEQNLLPDWFTVAQEELAEWTGLEPAAVEAILEQLVAAGYLNRRKVTAREAMYRLRFARALPVPRPKEEIAARLKARGWGAARRRWRYLGPPRLRKAERKVLDLYEQLFGARMNDRIAADLVEMAQAFDYPAIEEAFREAKKKGTRTLGWILCRLYQGEDDERIPKTRRRAAKAKPARRTAPDG